MVCAAITRLLPLRGSAVLYHDLIRVDEAANVLPVEDAPGLEGSHSRQSVESSSLVSSGAADVESTSLVSSLGL